MIAAGHELQESAWIEHQIPDRLVGGINTVFPEILN